MFMNYERFSDIKICSLAGLFCLLLQHKYFTKTHKCVTTHTLKTNFSKISLGLKISSLSIEYYQLLHFKC